MQHRNTANNLSFPLVLFQDELKQHQDTLQQELIELRSGHNVIKDIEMVRRQCKYVRTYMHKCMVAGPEYST